MIPFNSLLNIVKESKDLIYAATAFMKSSLFLPQLSIFGNINPCWEFKEVLCLTSFRNNIAEVPIFKILNNYKADVQSLGITSWFQILAMISERTI